MKTFIWLCVLAAAYAKPMISSGLGAPSIDVLLGKRANGVTPITKFGDQETSIRDACLFAHNKVRALHKNTGSVTYDDNIAVGAQQWAEYLAGMGGLQHDNSGYGENLYFGATSIGSAVYTPADAVFAWYEESWKPQGSSGDRPYDYSKDGRIQSGTGHFTQVVWKGSSKIGCGAASIEKDFNRYKMRYTYIVARYSAPGNYYGQYLNNVKALKAKATVPTHSAQLEAQGECIDKSTLCSMYRGMCASWKQYVEPVCRKTCLC